MKFKLNPTHKLRMKTEIQKLLTLKKFYKSLQITNDKLVLDLQKPSRILVQNIYNSWLRSIHGKTVQHFPIYLDENNAKQCQKLYYGYISKTSCEIDKINFDQNEDKLAVKNTVQLKLNLVIPQHDIMQYFIQWQRYRKYWWSSVTTTPSLFSINDMKHEDERSDVNIIANFKWGQHVVETISVNGNGTNASDRINANQKSACLTCNMGLETALVTILMDGMSNATKEDYLRLHYKLAPYKISFALDSKDPTVLKTLKDLARLLFHKLNSKEISAWLPCFSLPLESQVKENLHLGVTYTAVLSENTLSNGIFHLLNSSTMLKEQVHVADFDSYAALLCKK